LWRTRFVFWWGMIRLRSTYTHCQEASLPSNLMVAVNPTVESTKRVFVPARVVVVVRVDF
jgi:hypothetical protein